MRRVNQRALVVLHLRRGGAALRWITSSIASSSVADIDLELEAGIGRPTSLGIRPRTVAGLGREAADAEVGADHHHRQIDAVQQIGQVVIELGQQIVAVLHLLIDRVQLLVGRFEFFLGGLQFFVGALQLFVAGLDFFVGGLQLLVGGFLRFDDGLQVFLGGGELLLELRDLLVLFGASDSVRGSASLAASALRFRQGSRLEDDQIAVLLLNRSAEREDPDGRSDGCCRWPRRGCRERSASTPVLLAPPRWRSAVRRAGRGGPS